MCFLVGREAERILPHGVIMMGMFKRILRRNFHGNSTVVTAIGFEVRLNQFPPLSLPN